MHQFQTLNVLSQLTMSSPVIQTEQTVKATKVSTRQPTLPDKYGKFIQFAYYMMENVLGDDFQMDKALYLDKIALLGTVGEQQTLVQGFLNSVKDTKKNIKTLISDRKKAEAKANKPPKQSRAKKVASTDANGEVAPKRARKSAPKKGVQAANAELLDDLVHIVAQTQVAEPITPPTVVTPVVTNEKPAKKTKAVAKKPTAAPAEPVEPVNIFVNHISENDISAMLNNQSAEDISNIMNEHINQMNNDVVITNELVAEQYVVNSGPFTFAKDEEPPVIAKVATTAASKRKSQPKKAAKQAKEAPGTPVLDDIVIPGTDIEVSIINIDGKAYFMDDFSNLYNHPVPSAKSIGTFNPLNRKITYTN